MPRREPLDLTPEEREEYISAHCEEFKKSSGSAVAEMELRIKLARIPMDKDEIDFLVRVNRP